MDWKFYPDICVRPHGHEVRRECTLRTRKTRRNPSGTQFQAPQPRPGTTSWPQSSPPEPIEAETRPRSRHAYARLYILDAFHDHRREKRQGRKTIHPAETAAAASRKAGAAVGTRTISPSRRHDYPSALCAVHIVGLTQLSCEKKGPARLPDSRVTRRPQSGMAEELCPQKSTTGSPASWH